MDRISIKKGKADGRIYDVVSYEEYIKSIENEIDGDIAVEEGNYIYPKRGSNDTRPGVYTNEAYSVFKHPETEEEKEEYSINNVIDFDSKTLSEHINKTNRLKNMEKEILTTTDNIFMPPIHENDEPEMIALKKAVAAKQIDINKYAPRFGSNFQNDRRLFNDNKMSMYKFKSFLDNLDLKATIRIQDKNPNVANPMNKIIEVDLNDGGEVIVEDE